MKIFRRLFKKKVLILWYTIDSNLGDYFIYSTVKGYLDKWGYSCVAMDVGLPYSQIAEVAKKCDFLWFAGGGIIERGIPDIILQFEKFHKESKYIKYGITGLSIGGFDYSDKEKELSYWIHNSTFFYTRDVYSSDELNRIIGDNVVHPSVDVVFACDVGGKFLKKDNIYELGINFRELPYPDLSGEFNWKEWSNSITGIYKSVIGIPDQYDIAEKVSFEMASEYSPYNALEAISKSDIVIAMRFHVILFAAKMGKIPIPINYCPKVERLSKQLGIPKLVLGVHEYQDLRDKIEEIESNKILYQNVISENVIKMENDAKKLFELVKIELEKEI